MPRKIENFLTSGLPAKIYLLCYLNPESGYSLAQKIYPDKRYLATSKIYDWTDRLQKSDYLKIEKENEERKRKPFKSKIEPLIAEIKNELRKRSHMELTSREESLLKDLIIKDEFKSYFESFVIRKHGAREPERRVISSSSEEINALALINEVLGMLSTLCYVHHEFLKKSFVMDEKSLEQQYKSPYYTKLRIQELIEGARQFNKVAAHVEKLPDEFLLKLSTLWSDRDTIIYSYLVDSWTKHKEKR